MANEQFYGLGLKPGQAYKLGDIQQMEKLRDYQQSQPGYQGFQYYGQPEQYQGLQYPQPQQPQQQGDSGMLQMGQLGLDAYKSGLFGGGAGAAQFGGAEVASGAGMMGGGAQTAAGVGGQAGGGMGGAAASAGPWAALAAIIAVNEYNAYKGGYRDESKGEYAKDLFSGEVFHQDMEQRWLPKMGLEEGSWGNKWASVLANPLGMTADPKASFERIKGLF